MNKETTPQNPNPARVDVVLLTLKNGALHVALFKREHAPFAGAWALPGGFVHEDTDDTLQDAAFRVLKEKTGLQSPFLEELGSFSGRHRDPRGWSMTVAHFSVVPASLLDGLGDGVRLVNVADVPKLPFDHSDIVASALERVRSKATYSTLPVFLCEREFTLPQLKHAYDVATGVDNSAPNFQRKILELDVLEKAGDARASTKGRAAQLYRLKAERPVLFTRARGLVG